MTDKAKDYAAFVARTLAEIAVGAGETYEQFAARLTPLPELVIPISNPAPHHYRPSWQHMGDCHICGHVAESSLHIPAEAFVVVQAQGDLWQHTTHCSRGHLAQNPPTATGKDGKE